VTQDFGKILDQWEGGNIAETAGTPSGKPRQPEPQSQNQMNEWLNQYPPEESGLSDDGDSDDAHLGGSARRPHPDKLKADDTIDLHGYRLEEALEATRLFIERSVDSGFRKVVVIHGKGDNGQGILRREIRAYLEQHPMTGAMGHGRGAEGGTGALWVILRDRQGAESPPDRHRSR
jgi:DNA-nicking Smr family endonuclease